jgi:DNA-binding MarR family transcriptional regulator
MATVPLPARSHLLQTLARVGREHSDATVLFHAAVAERLGLHPTDEKALSLLQRLGPMSAGDLARQTGLATASVTNLVDRLERKGFVRRVSDPRDRRRIVVEAQPDRVEEAARLFQSTGGSLARLYHRYSVADLAVIADFLARNAARLRAETARLSSETGISSTA